MGQGWCDSSGSGLAAKGGSRKGKKHAMKIMLDKSPANIAERTQQFGYEFWQLRTPLTRYALANVPYGLDNGCFKTFKRKEWMALVEQAKENPPIFVCAPDIVGDARRTLELFDHFESALAGLPIALVLQDGIGGFSIPWDRIAAVFVGGSDAFKISQEAFAACKTAKILDKWVHVGRVNTSARAEQWLGIADSIDGSGLSQYDHMLKDVLGVIQNEVKQQELI